MNNKMIAWGTVGLLLAMPVGLRAQSTSSLEAGPVPRTAPPSPSGTLPAAEILASVRSAGFDPLGQPRLRGPVYVVFATDRYLMDVQLRVDARTGRVLTATRLAGAAYGGPVYEGYGTPRLVAPGYAAGRPRYEPAPVPPGEVPLQRPRRPAETAKRATPVPRARPDDTVTGDVTAPARAVESGGAAAAPAATPANAKPDQPRSPSPPAMVPIAPLE
jgi:hypothetical protein